MQPTLQISTGVEYLLQRETHVSRMNSSAKKQWTNVPRAHQYVRSAVPERDHFVRVAKIIKTPLSPAPLSVITTIQGLVPSHGDAKRTGESKIAQLELSLSVDQQILRLEITAESKQTSLCVRRLMLE